MHLHILRKKHDAVALTVYFLALIPSLLFWNIGHVAGTVLFFAVPGLYLIVRHWEIHAHAFLISTILGALTGFPMQVMAELNGVWGYNPQFPWLAIQNIPLEAVGWYVLWMGFTICIFRVFFDPTPYQKHAEAHPLKRHSILLFVTGAVVAGTLFLLFLRPDLLVIPHAYIVYASTLLIIPALAILFFHPMLLRDTIKAAVFLSLFALLYELVGLYLGWWHYSGSYLRMVSIAGIGIPIEELVIWIGLGSLGVTTEFELIERHERLLSFDTPTKR